MFYNLNKFLYVQFRQYAILFLSQPSQMVKRIRMTIPRTWIQNQTLPLQFYTLYIDICESNPEQVQEMRQRQLDAVDNNTQAMNEAH